MSFGLQKHLPVPLPLPYNPLQPFDHHSFLKHFVLQRQFRHHPFLQLMLLLLYCNGGCYGRRVKEKMRRRIILNPLDEKGKMGSILSADFRRFDWFI